MLRTQFFRNVLRFGKIQTIPYKVIQFSERFCVKFRLYLQKVQPFFLFILFLIFDTKFRETPQRKTKFRSDFLYLDLSNRLDRWEGYPRPCQVAHSLPK